MSKEELYEFRRLYGSSRDRDLAVKYDMTIPEVVALAEQEMLGKNKGRFPVRQMPRWTEEEIAVLHERFRSEPTVDVARLLDRTLKSVVAKAHSLGLKKSRERLRRMGQDNVNLRGDRKID